MGGKPFKDLYHALFSFRLSGPILFKKKYETANWSLRQGDEEVNKRIKQKNIYLNKLSNISVWKQTFFRG